MKYLTSALLPPVIIALILMIYGFTNNALTSLFFSKGAGERLAVTGLSIGDYAPDFRLKNVDGKYVSLADYKDARGFIIVFTCNHCPYAKFYEQRIIELANNYKDKGWHLIAINPNDPKKVPEDSYDNMKKRAKEKNYTFPYLFDETQVTSRTYGALRTPHAFVLKKESAGKYKLMYAGAIDDDTEDVKEWKEKYVEMAIEAIEKGEPVNPTITKAIGCTIKWKS